VLKAIKLAEPLLRGYNFNTGDAAEGEKASQLVAHLLDDELTCGDYFDSSELFTASDTVVLKKEMQNMFRNVTLLMDCVTCSKCKMWSKVHVLGLGTALKVVLGDVRTPATTEGHFQVPDADKVDDDMDSARPPPPKLTRNEIVALINTARSFSDSISATQKLYKLPYDAAEAQRKWEAQLAAKKQKDMEAAQAAAKQKVANILAGAFGKGGGGGGFGG
jgi:hypothetical protein